MADVRLAIDAAGVLHAVVDDEERVARLSYLREQLATVDWHPRYAAQADELRAQIAALEDGD